MAIYKWYISEPVSRAQLGNPLENNMLLFSAPKFMPFVSFYNMNIRYRHFYFTFVGGVLSFFAYIILCHICILYDFLDLDLCTVYMQMIQKPYYRGKYGKEE